VPDDMDDEIAAQIFITTLTVVGMVETAAVPKVLIATMHAALNSVWNLSAAIIRTRNLCRQCSWSV
jgi:hypothetical protein